MCFPSRDVSIFSSPFAMNAILRMPRKSAAAAGSSDAPATKKVRFFKLYHLMGKKQGIGLKVERVVKRAGKSLHRGCGF
jgi:hypothetical protein